MNEQQVPTRVTLAVGNEFPEWELDGVAGTTSEIQKLKIIDADLKETKVKCNEYKEHCPRSVSYTHLTLPTNREV